MIGADDGYKRPRDMFLEKYPLPFPGHIGSTGNDKPIVEWHLHDVLVSQGFDLDIQRDNKSVVDYQQVFDALARYQDPIDLVYSDELKQCIGLAKRVFGRRGDYLAPLHSEHEYRLSVKMEKASSAPLFLPKQEAFSRDFRRMEYYKKGRTYYLPPCVAYTRVQHGAYGPKTRLVWGYPLSVTLLEATFARPLIERFLNLRTPMAFGFRRQDLLSRMQRIRNSAVRISLDMSKFDSSIKPALIRAAFNILWTWFEDTPEHREWQKVIERYFIHTPILLADGDVYIKHQGVPSGSYFTQLVDSIVNFIAMQYLHLRLNGETVCPDKILVLGDDSVMSWYAAPDLQEMADVLRELRLHMNVEKTGVSRGNQPIHFLGHSFVNAFPSRPLEELVVRLVFPERRIGIDDRRERTATRLLSLYGDAIEGAELAEMLDVSHLDILLGFGSSLDHLTSGWLEHQRASSTYSRPSSSRTFAAASGFI